MIFMKNLSGIILCLGVMLNLITSNDIGVFGYISIGASIIAITALLFEVYSKKIKYLLVRQDHLESVRNMDNKSITFNFSKERIITFGKKMLLPIFFYGNFYNQ